MAASSDCMSIVLRFCWDRRSRLITTEGLAGNGAVSMPRSEKARDSLLGGVSYWERLKARARCLQNL
jgi:hypothetical protein